MSSGPIIIADYGIGNLASIRNMIKKVGGEAIISSDKNVLADARKIILPGVGSFKQAMDNLDRSGFVPVLQKKAFEDKIPFLGICLGMQLLTTYSEEGNSNGLNWIAAKTKRFSFSDPSIKVPHMSWTEIHCTKPDHPIFEGIGPEPRFYFVHSYYVTCEAKENVLAEATYGINFHCGIVKENIMGFQFHPEKSHRFGMTIMRNFIHNF